MKKIVIYTTATCPYCDRAKALLKSKGVLTWEEIRIDLEPERRDEMLLRAQRKTVPQIFIDDIHVGGCDDLYNLDKQGKLDILLRTN